MNIVRKLEAMGYPSRLENVITRTPRGRAEHFVAEASLDGILRIAKRIAPDTIKGLKELSQRCEIRLQMRFGVSQARDQIAVSCRGPLGADENDMLRALREAIGNDLSELFIHNGGCNADTVRDEGPHDRCIRA